MKIAFRGFLLTLLLCAMLTSLVACRKGELIDGIMYYTVYRDDVPSYYSVYALAEASNDKKIVYIPDEVNGLPVKSVSNLAYFSSAHFNSDAMERLYFPWSITYSDGERDNCFFGASSLSDYIIIISPSMNSIITYDVSFHNCVPLALYESMNASDRRAFIPANVAYMFNYEENPNEGYFFIDLVEDEGGVLTKPPYDPKREGYTFVGWFKDAGCEDAWSFESDTITLRFDENDYLIYEEIRLYAGWEKQ